MTSSDIALRMGAPLQQTGSVSAFRRLYVEHYGFAWATARRMGVRPDLVDDVVQDAFLTAFRRFADLPRDRPRAWLYGITRRVSSNYRRQERRRTRKHDALAVAGPRAVEVEGQLAARGALDRFMAGLDDGDRELFVLGVIEGMTGAELGMALQAPPSTLYGRLQSLRVRFRHEVGPAAPGVLRATATQRPRPNAVRWGLLEPLLTSPSPPIPLAAPLVPTTAAGTAWVKLALGGAAALVVAGVASPAWTSSEPDVPAAVSVSAATVDKPGLVMPDVSESVAVAVSHGLGVDSAQTPSRAVPPPVSQRKQRRRASRSSVAVSPSSVPTPEAEPRAVPGLQAEAALVRDASAALAQGDPKTALTRVAEHRSRFPEGSLSDAATALRIEALCADGRSRQARTEAATLLRETPTSPVAARVRRACVSKEKSEARLVNSDLPGHSPDR
ncbi:MAG: sigma-70 family RNA polymerase sigma factor [Nannocystaceae bacterium]|nr:sigma-70 family RNA polymerase sigma factor [Nannocystaceae bacterium]